MRTDDDLAALAARHLPAGVAERWLALRRPAVGLAPLPVGDVLTPLAGHLGGEPDLPPDLPWPVTADGRPLYHVATVDCAALPPTARAAGLPADGRLLFFVDEGLFDDYGPFDDGPFDDADDHGEDGDGLGALPPPGSARLLHLPAGTPVRRRSTPPRGNAYERTRLGAWAGATAPVGDHPELHRAFGDAYADAPEHPLRDWRFRLAADGEEPRHRLGGHPSPLRHPVELDAAAAALGGGAGWQNPALYDEALHWRQLAQFDRGDPGIAWHGDDGVQLHWLLRADDLAAGRFERAVFTVRRPYRN